MLEFKPRTHSDPDLPQLLPLPVRPHSSYQAKLQFKDQAQFQEQVVHAMAQKLGIDLVRDAVSLSFFVLVDIDCFKR